MADGYDTDFYAWTQAQAQALRTRGAGGNALDYDNLAEEIETLGRSNERACESLIQRILEHLLKIEFIADPDCLRGWRKEISAFRRRLDRSLSPSLRAHLPASLPDLYEAARERITFDIEDQALDLTLPQQSPYSFDDVLGRGEGWLPEPGPQATT